MPIAFQYPETTEQLDQAVLVVDLQLLPFLGGAMARLMSREYWQSDPDYYRASEAISSFLECSMSTCLSDLIESNNRIYRLLDTAIFGTAYSVITDDPLVVDPIIWPVRDLSIADENSMLGRMEDMKQLLQNAMNGTSTANYDREFGVRDLLEQLKAAIEADNEVDAESLEQLLQIAALLA